MKTLLMAFDLHTPFINNFMTDDRKTGDNKISQPDPETLQTTDPQENMEGPVSNMIQDAGDVFDSSEKTEKEANKKREEGF
jgi:hypothetical protein